MLWARGPNWKESTFSIRGLSAKYNGFNGTLRHCATVEIVMKTSTAIGGTGNGPKIIMGSSERVFNDHDDNLPTKVRVYDSDVDVVCPNLSKGIDS